MVSNHTLWTGRFKHAVTQALAGLIVLAGAAAANAANIGYVVDPGAAIDEPFDIFWTERLETQGHVIIPIGADEPADGFPDAEIFIISNDVDSNAVIAGFGLDDPRPQISSGEWGLNDEWGMADAQGDTPDAMTITIVDPTHPLAAGLSGQVDVFTDVQPMSSFGPGIPADQLEVIATVDHPAGFGDVPVMAVFEKGTPTGPTALVDPSPGLRIFLFSRTHPAGGDLYSDDGLKILDTAVNYALGLLAGAPPLQAGDADQDLDFDQLDLVRVQIAAKYLTGRAATWGEGDWNGAPGGQQGSPPAGNGFFDQLDIIAALGSDKYLKGKYAAVRPGGVAGDGQTSIVYNPTSGELSVDAPAGTQLTSINIDSAARIFTGAPAQNLGGSFDNDSDANIFKATFGSSFGSLTFGNVAQAGLSEQFVLGDLTVVGSLAGGGGLGNVDLIYVPEPQAVILLAIGLVLLGAKSWQHRTARRRRQRML
jgi:hypothetical protein